MKGQLPWREGGMGPELHGGTDMDLGNGWGALSDGFSFFVESKARSALASTCGHLPHVATKPFKYGQSKEMCSQCKKHIKFWT